MPEKVRIIIEGKEVKAEFLDTECAKKFYRLCQLKVKLMNGVMSSISQ